MIEPRSPKSALIQLFMIQSERTDWIIWTPWGNSLEASGHCPSVGPGFGFGLFPAKSDEPSLYGLGGLRGERPCAFIFLQANLVSKLTFGR